MDQVEALVAHHRRQLALRDFPAWTGTVRLAESLTGDNRVRLRPLPPLVPRAFSLRLEGSTTLWVADGDHLGLAHLLGVHLLGADRPAPARRQWGRRFALAWLLPRELCFANADYLARMAAVPVELVELRLEDLRRGR